MMIFKVVPALVMLLPCVTGAWKLDSLFEDYAGSYDFEGSYDLGGGDDDYGVDTIQSYFYSKTLYEGETSELVSHGPFTLKAACTAIDGEGDVQARLLMTVTAGSQDEWVYGSPDFQWIGSQDCVGTTAAGTTAGDCVVWSVGSGNGDGGASGGAYTSLSGYYVGFGGSSAIGFSKSYLSDPDVRQYHDGFSASEVADFPYDCAMSGEIKYNG